MRTIAQISDLHFGRHDGVVVEALLASLQASGCDLVVVSGDLTQRARSAEFAAAEAFLDRVGPAAAGDTRQPRRGPGVPAIVPPVPAHGAV